MKRIGYRVLAALTFFTRLPFWRIANVPKEYYERVVPLWAMTGWITGGIMSAVFCIANIFIPTSASIILTLTSRILVTGALHEDGYADFCDGFGGGASRERVLEIMKDSHIGSYGVLGLVLYYILIFTLMCNIPTPILPIILVLADVYSKFIGANIINILPYARKESEAKNKVIYHRMNVYDVCVSSFFGLLPVCIYMYCLNSVVPLIPMSASAITAIILFRMMHNRIKGYTGDCCGAVFVITETVFYITFTAIC